MMTGGDVLYGVAAIVSAIFAGVATVIGALNHRTVSNIDRKTDTNGDPRELGGIMSDVGKAVAPTGPAPAAVPPPSPPV